MTAVSEGAVTVDVVVFGGADGLADELAGRGWRVRCAEDPDALAASDAPDRAVLVGIGEGAVAVAEFADDHPERAAAVVLIGTVPDEPDLDCPVLVLPDAGLAPLLPFLAGLGTPRTEACPVTLPALTPTLLNDPDLMLRFRELGPVHRINAPGVSTSWILTGHAATTATLADPALCGDFAITAGFRLQQPGIEHRGERDLVTITTAEHVRLRRLVGRYLTPARVDQLRPALWRETGRLLDALPTREPVDLLMRFARPLPIVVLCELLGVPETYRGYVHEWLIERMTTVPPAAHADVDDYLRGLIEARRREPADDLLGWVVAAEGDALDPEDLISAARLLMVGGHRAPTTLLANGVAALLRAPGQWARLVADPALVPSAVEELLRLVSPFPVGLARAATGPVNVDGTTVPPGDLVAASLVAANRDPAVFADPDELDVDRGACPHLAFGHGNHYCLGAALARAQAQVAIEALVRRFPRLTLADEARLQYRQSRVRYLLELPVVLDPPEGN